MIDFLCQIEILLLKIYRMNEIFLSSSNFFLLNNTFKVTLQYLFNVFILFNTVSYI